MVFYRQRGTVKNMGEGEAGRGEATETMPPRVQELFEFSLYLMKWPGKTNFTSGAHQSGKLFSKKKS